MKNNFCRLKPSNIEGAGIGVFAIEDILCDINPFIGCDTKLRNMFNDEFNSLSNEKKKMVRDFCYHSSGNWRVPENFNILDISWYVNSSTNPNLSFDTKKGVYKTLRNITKGEELTYEYIIYE